MAVPVAEQRKLLQRSGGICAFPRCRRALTAEPSAVDQTASLGEIAHIVGDSPHGPRGSSPLTAEERNRCENLILLCNYHHQLIDSQTKTWTVDRLLAMKQTHEQRVLRRLGAIDAVTAATAGNESADADFLDWFVRTGDALPRVCQVHSRAALGIHAARPLAAHADGELSADFPTYIARDVDDEIRQILDSAQTEGGFVVLVGATAAGKSRSAFEAIRATLPHWGLILPPSPVDLEELTRSGIPLGRCVIWLDELATYLDSGHLTSSAVRRLLSDRQEPVVLIGTLWPTDYERIHDPVNVGDAASPAGEARAVLSVARIVDIPERFSDAELTRAREIAEVDSRVMEAVATLDAGAPPTVLACAPELLRRWNTPGSPTGAAVVSAAVEARLCGHPSVIPSALLERLAEEYLTPAQRAVARPDWFASALAWACKPVRGEIAPLLPVAPRIGQVTGYVVSDVLTYHQAKQRSTARRLRRAPWDILIAEAELDACSLIGMRAALYGLTEHVITALTRLAESGAEDIASILAMAHYDQGDLKSARRWFMNAHEHGHTEAMGMLAVIHRDLGDLEEARSWLRRGAEAGDVGAMMGWGSELENDGDLESARAWYERAAQSPAGHGPIFLGTFLRNRGDLEDARDCFQQAVDYAHAQAKEVLPHLLADADDPDTPAARIRQTFTDNVADAAGRLGEVQRALGEIEAAAFWLNKAAQLGNVTAMAELGAMLWDLDEHNDAARWLKPAAEAGIHDAMFYLALILDDRGDSAAAGAWLAKAAEGGASYAMGRYALYLQEQGDIEGAQAWGQRAHEAGDPIIEDALAALSASAGQGPMGPEPDDEASHDGGDLSASVHWMPLEQACGCVIDWGWSPLYADPLSTVTTKSCLMASGCHGWRTSEVVLCAHRSLGGRPWGSCGGVSSTGSPRVRPWPGPVGVNRRW